MAYGRQPRKVVEWAGCEAQMSESNPFERLIPFSGLAPEDKPFEWLKAIRSLSFFLKFSGGYKLNV